MLLDRPPSPVHPRQRCRRAGSPLRRDLARRTAPLAQRRGRSRRLRSDMGATERFERVYGEAEDTGSAARQVGCGRSETGQGQKSSAARREDAPLPLRAAVSRTVSPVPAAPTSARGRRRSVARVKADSADRDRVGRPRAVRLRSRPRSASSRLRQSGILLRLSDPPEKRRNFRDISTSFFRFSAHRIRCV